MSIRDQIIFFKMGGEKWVIIKNIYAKLRQIYNLNIK